MLGTSLLTYRLLTLEAVEGGTVAVESEPLPYRRRNFWWKPHKHEQQQTFVHDLDEFLSKEHPKLHDSYLPWAKLQVQDGDGKFNSIWVNVDTGSNQELSLPTNWVTRLRLEPSSRCLLDTAEGLIEADQGEVEVIWQGEKRAVQCTHTRRQATTYRHGSTGREQNHHVFRPSKAHSGNPAHPPVAAACSKAS